MRKTDIDTAIRKITEWLEEGTLSEDDRRRLQNIQDNLLLGKLEYEDLLLDAELRGIRNPSFPGDLIGWLDDDFGLDVYGHLSQIEPHLYLGAKVRGGEVIGTIADRGSDTHLHIQVNTFGVSSTSHLLRRRFGAVISTGNENPLLVIDPMLFVVNKGTPLSPITASPSCTTPYQYTRYNNANIYGIKFDYIVRDNLRLKCFHTTTGAISDSGACNTVQP
jgi:hypothetical protein